MGSTVVTRFRALWEICEGFLFNLGFFIADSAADDMGSSTVNWQWPRTAWQFPKAVSGVRPDSPRLRD